MIKEILEIGLAFGAHQRVRVFALWKKEKLCLPPVLHGGQGGLEATKCRLAPRVITVKAEYDFGYDAKQPLQVGLAGGGAEGGNRVRNAVLRQGNHIHVPLNYNDAFKPPRVFSSLPQAIEFSGFLEDGCLGRIQVFGFVITQHPPAKGDDPTALVLNREHHALAKPVVGPAFVIGHQHP